MGLPVDDPAHVRFRGSGTRLPRIRQVFVHGSAAHWTRPPSIGLTPLMRMSTLLRLAPLSAVTVERILVLAATVRSQMDPPYPATRPASRTTAVSGGILIGDRSDRASRPSSYAQSARTSWGS